MRLSPRDAFLVHWLLVSLVVAAEAWLVPGLRIDSVPLAIAGAVVIGLLNAAVRPILTGEAELRGLMLGVAYVALNAFVFGVAADWFVDIAAVRTGVGVVALLIPGLTSALVAMVLVPEE